MVDISVLVAAYNVDKYLDSSLNSLLGQTHKNIEIIAVDDGSTDRTPEILAAFAAADSRVRVLTHEKNRGLMLARKTAFAAATGRYIMFLDGDDAFPPQACERAFSAIERERVDVLQFETELFADEGATVSDALRSSLAEYFRSVSHKVLTSSKAGLLDEKAIGGRVNLTIWNKIYKRELLSRVYEHIPEEHIFIAEDVLFSFIAQFFARSFSYTDKVCHKYRIGSGVTTVSTVSDVRLEGMAKCLFVYRYLRRFAEEQKASEACRAALLRIQNQMMDNVAHMLLRLPKSRQEFFVERASHYGEPEDIVLVLSHYLFLADYRVHEDTVAQMASRFSVFRKTRTEVRTVGAFYFRMYNGGVENVLSMLIAVWREKGYRVVLFTDEESNEKDYDIPSEVTRVVLPTCLPSDDAEKKQARIHAFREGLIENGVDLLVYNAWINSALLPDMLTVKSCGIPLMMHTHGLFCCDWLSGDPYAAVRNASLGTLYRLADSVVALTETDAAVWRAFGHLTFKTANPIKLTRDVTPRINGGHSLLLVGRISREKQVLDALAILELVRKKYADATLTLVGTGENVAYMEEIEQYIKEHDLKRSVTLAGFHLDVLPFYQKADVMLCTSKYEGFCLAISESKVCGLPLVAYRLPNRDFMREPRGLFAVEQGDVEAAADAVIRIFSDDALRAEMSREARASAEETHFNVDLGARWQSFFEQTVSCVSEKREDTPLEAAMRLAASFAEQGARVRASVAASADGSGYANAQHDELVRMINGLANSESYRLGMALTAFPRWLKRVFKGRRK